MTGTGGYFYIVWGIWLRHCLNGEQDEFDLHWPTYWSLPEVRRVKPPTTYASSKSRNGIASASKRDRRKDS